MRLFILYLLTLFIFWGIHLLNITYLFNRFFPENGNDETDEFEADPEQLKELLHYFFYMLLYTLAFISFAILPAVVKHNVLSAIGYGLFMTAVVSLSASLINFKFTKHVGLKRTLYGFISNLITSSIVAAVSYFIARLLLT